MNGQYYQGPYGYSPGVIQETQQQANSNVNGGPPNYYFQPQQQTQDPTINGRHNINNQQQRYNAHQPRQYSMEMMNYPPHGYNTLTAQSPALESTSDGQRYSQFLKTLVVAQQQQQQQQQPQAGHTGNGHFMRFSPQQQQNLMPNDPNEMNMDHRISADDVDDENDNHYQRRGGNRNNLTPMTNDDIDGMDGDGVVRRTPQSHDQNDIDEDSYDEEEDQYRDDQDEDEDTLGDDMDEPEITYNTQHRSRSENSSKHRKSSKSSREHRASYTEQQNSRSKSKRKKSRARPKLGANKSYGFTAKGVRMDTPKKDYDHQYPDYSDNETVNNRKTPKSPNISNHSGSSKKSKKTSRSRKNSHNHSHNHHHSHNHNHNHDNHNYYGSPSNSAYSSPIAKRRKNGNHGHASSEDDDSYPNKYGNGRSQKIHKKYPQAILEDHDDHHSKKKKNKKGLKYKTKTKKQKKFKKKKKTQIFYKKSSDNNNNNNNTILSEQNGGNDDNRSIIAVPSSNATTPLSVTTSDITNDYSPPLSSQSSAGSISSVGHKMPPLIERKVKKTKLRKHRHDYHSNRIHSSSSNNHNINNHNTNNHNTNNHKKRKIKTKIAPISINPPSSTRRDTPTSNGSYASNIHNQHIHASTIMNKYKKPKPLSPITPHTPIIQQSHIDGLVLESADTLTKKFTTTQKTVDLPSPNPRNSNNNHNRKKNKNKNKNKNKKKKKKKKNKDKHIYSEEETVDDDYSDDDDDDDDDEDGMVMTETYDVYNSISQTEDESPIPDSRRYGDKRSRKKIYNKKKNKHRNNHRIVEERNDHSENLVVDTEKLNLLNSLSGNTEQETQEETDEYEYFHHDNIASIAPSSKTSTLWGVSQGGIMGHDRNSKPRFSTLSIGSELQDQDLILEDESIMDQRKEYISPRIKDSNCIEFYVDTDMQTNEIYKCFGSYQPHKVIPHAINANQAKRKVEAIFDDHDTANKAVSVLKQQLHQLQVVFKKSPRMTLVSEKGKTPILQPISSGAPFSSQPMSSNANHSLKLVSNDSVSTAGGGDDFGTINYIPHKRPGQAIMNGNGDNNSNGSEQEMDWTEGDSSDDDNDNSDDDDSQVWALEKGFSGSDSDDNDLGQFDEEDDDEDDHQQEQD